MNENLVKKAVQDFSKDNKPEYKKAFRISGAEDDVYIVTIERKRRIVVTESVSMEARSNTISALPSGTPCGCCGGSGKS